MVGSLTDGVECTITKGGGQRDVVYERQRGIDEVEEQRKEEGKGEEEAAFQQGQGYRWARSTFGPDRLKLALNPLSASRGATVDPWSKLNFPDSGVSVY